MIQHPFATLSQQGESGLNSAEFAALFAPDVTLNGPFLMQPLNKNKDLTLRFVREVFALANYPRYIHQFNDGNGTTLFIWHGDVKGPDGRDFTLEGTVAITEGDDGLIHEITGYLRPLQVAGLLKEAAVSSIASILPQEYWTATPKNA